MAELSPEQAQLWVPRWYGRELGHVNKELVLCSLLAQPNTSMHPPPIEGHWECWRRWTMESGGLGLHFTSILVRGSFWAQPTEEGKKSPSIAHLREPHCQREIAGQHSTKMTFCSHLKTVSKDLWALDHSGSQQDGLGSSELGISMDCKVKWREITLNPFTPDMETLNIQMVASVIWPE